MPTSRLRTQIIDWGGAEVLLPGCLNDGEVDADCPR